MRARWLLAPLLVVLATGVASAAAPDTTKLPLGDRAFSTTTAAVGRVYSCNAEFNGGGAQAQGPWIDAAGRTWNKKAKLAVQGSVRWTSRLSITTAGATTKLSGNGLPSTPTGTFPVAASDPAYQYDRNPNRISSWSLEASLPSTPKVAAKPSCVGGMIGYSVLGVPIFSAFDAQGKDAVANEVQDSCDGHPERSGHYHFHSLSRCYKAPAGSDPGLFGYALDGFGIYAEPGLGSKDLDVCHGRTSVVTWRGKKTSVYHYVATDDFPYLVGCFRGTPVQTRP